MQICIERGNPYWRVFEAESSHFAVRCPIGGLDSSKVSYESWLSEKYHDLGRKIQRLDPPGGAPFPFGEGEGTLIGALLRESWSLRRLDAFRDDDAGDFCFL